MAISYDTPLARTAEAKVSVVAISIDQQDQTAVITVQRQTATGGHVREDSFSVGPIAADFTWAQFIANVPSLGALRREIELALQAAGKLPSGTVS